MVGIPPLSFPCTLSIGRLLLPCIIPSLVVFFFLLAANDVVPAAATISDPVANSAYSKNSSVLPPPLVTRGNNQYSPQLPIFPANIRCLENERTALLQLKEGLVDPDGRLSSWRRGLDCCLWVGITCGHNLTAGSVVKIDLNSPVHFILNYVYFYYFPSRSEKYLSGRVDFSIMLQLKSLQHLDLSGNSFHGNPTIPNLIGSFKELRYLNLSHSGLVGPIPPQLGNLSSLQYLDLSNDVDPPGLLREDHNLNWVAGLSSLRHLALNGVDLSSVRSGWLHLLNKQLPFLRELHLRECRLESKINGHHNIAPSLGGDHEDHAINFTSLEVIDLSFNPFSHWTIPNWLLNITSLRYIDMINTDLHGQIPVGFSKLPYLRHLNLGSNDYLTADVSELLGGSSGQGGGYWPRINTLRMASCSLYGEIPESIGNITSLEWLDLSLNTFIEGRMPSSIGKLLHLTALILNYNGITEELPPTIWSLPSLTYLSIYGNRLTGIIGPAHLSSLGNKLKVLALGGNSLILMNNINGSFNDDWIPPFQLTHLDLHSCQVGPTFPSWIKSQRELRRIILSDTGISDENILTWLWDLPSKKHHLQRLNLSQNNLIGGIPTSIGELHNLVYLSLSRNNLTGGIPASIGELHNLTFLDLSENSLTGGIPASIGELCNLTLLDLSENSLTGGIPASIGKLHNLKILSLSKNSLSGGIPTSIGELHNLDFFDLSKNNLTGGIPTSIGELHNLASLYLSGNNLTGGIPTSIGELHNLTHLYLSENSLTGGILTSIGELQNLTFLDLSRNNLTGGIPTSMGKLQELQVLDLSSNELGGHIPTSLLNCSSLQFLNLGENKFHGGIPTSPINISMEGLELLNVSGNALSGEFPSFVRNLSKLMTIDVANNKLYGNIPTWIGSIQSLVILRLRSNGFSGGIPSQLSNLKLLQVLDLARNNLTGHIPEQLDGLSSMLRKTSQQYFDFTKSGMIYAQVLVVHMKDLDLSFDIRATLLVASIDLSENKLSGGFPASLINLSGLVVLDLSKNSLSGTIPQRIGDMRELQSLDLSNNHFTGGIPSSMRYMSFLGFLNLSSNNLSGEIPVGGQMDTFNEESIFLGNPYLCGPFIQRHCPRGVYDDPAQRHMDVDKDEVAHTFEVDWFCMGLGFGFAFGLLTPILILLIKRSWSDAYFEAMDRIIRRLS